MPTMTRDSHTHRAGRGARFLRGTRAGLAGLVLAGALALPAAAQSLTATAVTVTEGGYARVWLKLSAPVDYAIRYFYVTRAGTAAADEDYEHTAGTVYIHPGRWSQSVTVRTETDSRATEGDEHFFLDFTGLRTLGRTPGVYTWTHDPGAGLPQTLTARATIENRVSSPQGASGTSFSFCHPRKRAYGFC